MGAPCTPVFANIFMVTWEIRYIFNSPFKSFIRQYNRYLDDLFILWGGNETQLWEFHHYLNSVTGYLKFAISYSKERIYSLNVELFKKDIGFATNIYQNPTYCNATLCGRKKSLIEGQMACLSKLVSDDNIFDKMVKLFWDRGYPRDLVHEIRNKLCIEA